MAAAGLPLASHDGEGEPTISLDPVSPVVPRPGPRRSESGLGLAYMAAGMFLFSLVDTQAKFLTDTLHPTAVVLLR